MNYSILCIGSLKERYWKEAEQEYRKRIRRFGSWNVTELPEYPLPEHPSEKEIARALQKEGEALKHKISPAEFFHCALRGRGALLQRRAGGTDCAHLAGGKKQHNIADRLFLRPFPRSKSRMPKKAFHLSNDLSASDDAYYFSRAVLPRT